MRDELTSEVAKFGLGGNAGPLPAIYREKKTKPG
jgi:predicted component of type VI protein secretion system